MGMWKSLGCGVVGVVLKHCALGSLPVRWDSAFSPRGVFYDGAVFSVEKYLYDDSGGNVHNVSIFGTFDTCENNT